MLRNAILNIQCVETHQWLKLYVTHLHQFLIFKKTHCTRIKQLGFPPCKQFFTCTRQVSNWQGAEGGFTFLKRKVQRCIRPSYRPFRYLNLQQKSSYNTTKLCCHSQLYTELPFGPQTTHMDHHFATEKQLEKTNYLSVVFFECAIFLFTIKSAVMGDKTNCIKVEVQITS